MEEGDFLFFAAITKPKIHSLAAAAIGFSLATFDLTLRQRKPIEFGLRMHVSMDVFPISFFSPLFLNHSACCISQVVVFTFHVMQ